MPATESRFSIARAEGQTPELVIFGGSTVRILTRGDQHAARLTVIDYRGNGRSSPPAFTRHDFEEIFCVVSGRLAFQYFGESPFIASAGEVVSVQGGRAHTFWNPDDPPVHVLLVAAPAGLELFFEESAKVLTAQRAGDLDSEAAAKELNHVRERHGIEVVAPAPTTGPGIG